MFIHFELTLDDTAFLAGINKTPMFIHFESTLDDPAFLAA
mgnify:CR=1 FL=1